MADMITPVQRIPRYQLLLRELEKNTDKDHPEWEDIQEANKEIISVATHINERRRDQEIYRVLANISETYDMEPMSDGFLVKGRVLVMECDMLEFNHGKLKPSARKVFLFTDMLLLISIKKNQYNSHFKLNTAPIPWIDGEVTAATTTDFELVSAMGNVSLRAHSAEDRDKFCRALQEVIDNLVKTVPKMKDQPLADKTANKRLRRGQKQLLPDEEEQQQQDAATGPQYEPVVVTTMDFESTKISFRAGELLFVKHKFPDGSILASNGSSVPGAVQPRIQFNSGMRTGKVTSEYYREMTDEEKLASEYVSRKEKSEAAQRVAETIAHLEPTVYGPDGEWTIAECPFYGEQIEEPGSQEMDLDSNVEDISSGSPQSAPTCSSFLDSEDTSTDVVSDTQEQEKSALQKKSSSNNLFKKLQLKLLRKPGIWTPRSASEKRRSLGTQQQHQEIAKMESTSQDDSSDSETQSRRVIARRSASPRLTTKEQKQYELEEEQQRLGLLAQKEALEAKLLALGKLSPVGQQEEKDTREVDSKIQVAKLQRPPIPGRRGGPKSRKSGSARKGGATPDKNGKQKEIKNGGKEEEAAFAASQAQQPPPSPLPTGKEQQQEQSSSESPVPEDQGISNDRKENLDSSSTAATSKVTQIIIPSSENVRKRFSLKSAREQPPKVKPVQEEQEEEPLAPWIRELRDRANRGGRGSGSFAKVLKLAEKQNKEPS